MREGGEAEILQQGVELGHAVLTQEEDGRDVEGAGQGLGGRDGAVVLAVKVLRSESAQVHGNIRQQGARQNLPFLQRSGVQEGLKDAARGSGRGCDIHLDPAALALRRGIAHIRHYLSAGIVKDHDGQIGHALFGQVVGLPVRHGRYGLLQRQPDAGARPHPLGAALHEVRSIGRKRQGSLGQRFLQRRLIGIGR